MSLILEALRRSEAERRRGLPPTLLGEPGPRRPERASAWPMALGGLLLGALLAAAGAWWWSLGREASTAATPPTSAATAAVGSTDTRPAPPVEPVPAAAYAPSRSTTPAAPAPRPAPVMPAPSASPAADVSADLPPPPTTDTAPVATALPGAEASSAADTGAGPREGDLPWSAVAGEALPSLRVSMQVYADAPERRFAIIDGQRRREGDALPSGLTLLEIRRDGLRLGWQGRVLWVPR